MIGKVITGKSFRGYLMYCLNDKIQQQQETVMKNRAEILVFNKCFGDQQELIQQFNDVRWLNPKLSKPVMHITLSLAPGEHLTKDKWMEVAEQCAKDMGFENNQYVAIQHKDTGHEHLHIVVNRVGFEKQTVSDSNSYKKIAAHCRKMELKYELKQVLSPKRYLSKSQQLLPRQDQRKQQLTAQIQQALKSSRNFGEFERAMKEKGYQVIKGRGISFLDDKKVKIKGSEVDYSLRTIERILGQQKTLVPHSFINPLQQSGTLSTNHRSLNDISKDLSRLVDVLVKPTQTNGAPDDTAPQQKFKKKRKRSHHL
jgi:asparagine synthetase B (glutamine-hydrolysing)